MPKLGLTYIQMLRAATLTFSTLPACQLLPDTVFSGRRWPGSSLSPSPPSAATHGKFRSFCFGITPTLRSTCSLWREMKRGRDNFGADLATTLLGSLLARMVRCSALS